MPRRMNLQCPNMPTSGRKRRAEHAESRPSSLCRMIDPQKGSRGAVRDLRQAHWCRSAPDIGGQVRTSGPTRDPECQHCHCIKHLDTTHII